MRQVKVRTRYMNKSEIERLLLRTSFSNEWSNTKSSHYWIGAHLWATPKEKDIF